MRRIKTTGSEAMFISCYGIHANINTASKFRKAVTTTIKVPFPANYCTLGVRLFLLWQAVKGRSGGGTTSLSETIRGSESANLFPYIGRWIQAEALHSLMARLDRLVP